MAKSIELEIEPSILIWARESIGLSINEAAKRITKITPDKLIEIESGKTKPTLTLLKRMTVVYKRPLAAFFLSTPPDEKLILPDFRTISHEQATFSPSILLCLRKLRRLQAVLAEFRDDFGIVDKKMPSIADDIESGAEEFRRYFNVSLKDQLSWKTSTDALSKWRLLLESFGVFVIQLSGVELKDMRGLSLADDVPIIAVNGRDSATARIFTIFHELAHITFNVEGICDLQPEEQNLSDASRRLETRCNYFSAAFLVPREPLLTHPIVAERQNRKSWPDEQLKKLARVFNVSPEVILRRLVTLGLADWSLYRKKHYQWQEEYEKIPTPKVPTTPAGKCIREKGQSIVSVILDNYHRETIGPSEVSDYLGIRLKHLGELEKLVRPHS